VINMMVAVLGVPSAGVVEKPRDRFVKPAPTIPELAIAEDRVPALVMYEDVSSALPVDGPAADDDGASTWSRTPGAGDRDRTRMTSLGW
jgi:hypothetical protein